jgi:drug/metabolite transporter (DMT)-like permease
MNITADTGFVFIIVGSTISLINYLNGSESVNARNLFIIFVSSCLGMICWLVGQNCLVKGLAGPTSAIINSGCFYTALLQVIFLGLVPTLSQILAALVTFAGIIVMIFYK